MNLILRNIGRFFLLVLLQVLVLNNIYLGGFITPFLYILFVLMLPTSLPKPVTLLLAFAAGLTVDICCNMLGFHAFCATLVGLCRVTFADRILTRGENIVIDTPSLRSVPAGPALYYLFLLILIYNTAYFLLIHFSFHDLLRILLSAVLSSAVTWALCILYQTLIIRKEH